MIANTQDFTDQQKLEMALQLIRETEDYQSLWEDRDSTISQAEILLEMHINGQRFI